MGEKVSLAAINSQIKGIQYEIQLILSEISTVAQSAANSTIIFSGNDQLVGSNATGVQTVGRLINNSYIDDAAISTVKILGLDGDLSSINSQLATINSFIAIPSGKTIIEYDVNANPQPKAITILEDIVVGLETAYSVYNTVNKAYMALKTAYDAFKLAQAGYNTLNDTAISTVETEVGSLTTELGTLTTSVTTLTTSVGTLTTGLASNTAHDVVQDGLIAGNTTLIGTTATALEGEISASAAAIEVQIAALYALLILSGLFGGGGKDSSGTAIPVTTSNYSGQIAAINLAITNLQTSNTTLVTDDNASKTFLNAMVTAGFATFASNTYTLTSAFTGLLAAVNANTTSIAQNVVALVNTGYLTKTGTSPNFVYSVTGSTVNAVTTLATLTGNQTIINKTLQDSGLFSGPYTETSGLSNITNGSGTTVVPPTVNRILSGNGTYTTPSSPSTPIYLRIRMCAGGGGGGGAVGSNSGSYIGGNGTNGGNTTFGSNLICYGGSGGTGSSNNPSGGGSFSITSASNQLVLYSVAGSNGSGGLVTVVTNANAIGGSGGSNPFGCGVGGGPYGSSGLTPPPNTGAGGSGGGPASNNSQQYGGSGGGAGGYIDLFITNPSSNYTYSVGSSGVFGNGGGGGNQGGNGSSGVIIIEEYYPPMGASTSIASTVAIVNSTLKDYGLFESNNVEQRNSALNLLTMFYNLGFVDRTIVSNPSGYSYFQIGGLYNLPAQINTNTSILATQQSILNKAGILKSDFTQTVGLRDLFVNQGTIGDTLVSAGVLSSLVTSGVTNYSQVTPVINIATLNTLVNSISNSLASLRNAEVSVGTIAGGTYNIAPSAANLVSDYRSLSNVRSNGINLPPFLEHCYGYFIVKPEYLQGSGITAGSQIGTWFPAYTSGMSCWNYPGGANVAQLVNTSGLSGQGLEINTNTGGFFNNSLTNLGSIGQLQKYTVCCLARAQTSYNSTSSGPSAFVFGTDGGGGHSMALNPSLWYASGGNTVIAASNDTQGTGFNMAQYPINAGTYYNFGVTIGTNLTSTQGYTVSNPSTGVVKYAVSANYGIINVNQITLYINGKSKATSAFSSNGPTTYPGLGCGGTNTLSDLSTGGKNFNSVANLGFVCNIVYKKEMSTSEMDTINTWMNTNFGLSLT
jgi:hypothetical protein